MPVQVEETEDYRTKYKNLKRKLKLLIYENECFQEELGKANRALLRVQQDSSFLVEQLLPHYRPPISSSDSDVTDHSDTETVGSTVAAHAVKRRRLTDVGVSSGSSIGTVNTTVNTGNQGRSLASGGGGVAVAGKPGKQPVGAASSSTSGIGGAGPKLSYGARGAAVAAPVSAGKKRGQGTATGGTRGAGKQGQRTSANRQRRTPQKLQRVANFGSSDGGGSAGVGTDASSSNVLTDTTAAHVEPELSREEVERRLLARQSNSDMSMQASIPLTLPQQIFSDNIMDGDLLMEEIETSPSNLEEDITVDNYD